MITAYLQGGMGNQMFIYAAARAAAMRLDTGLALDTSSFEHDPMRRYSLGLWAGITAPIERGAYPFIQEEGLPYNPTLVERIQKNCTLKGYFQCEEYFKEIKFPLLREFTPKQPLAARAVETERAIRAAGPNSVFLTVRRTDYTKSDFHGVLPLEYYKAALDVIASKVYFPHVFVFSDEPEWCESNFKLPCKMTIAGNFDRTTREHLGREDEELWLMRQCRHAIMANSSYSWWGAWTGADETGGTVIAPKRWFFSANEDPRDIVPSRWLSI